MVSSQPSCDVTGSPKIYFIDLFDWPPLFCYTVPVNVHGNVYGSLGV